MGLAASQAKLLSLTCRISDNELRSQSITAAKMALANQTTEASREYMKALNTNEFIYRTYDDNGEKVYTKLTGTQLSAYAPLKNQYALINSQGQVLVSEKDGKNYEASSNMEEFLAKYGIKKVETGKTMTVANPEYENAYKIWQENKPHEDSDIYWENVSRTVQTFNSIKNFNTMYNSIASSIDSLVLDTETQKDNAKKGLFKLFCLIDFNGNFNDKGKSYQSTIHAINDYYSDNFNITSDHFNDNSNINLNSAFSQSLQDCMKELSNAISNGYSVNGETCPIYAPEDTNDTLTLSSSDYEKILSSYYYDSAGVKQLKTMHQYLLDLYYATLSTEDYTGGVGEKALVNDYSDIEEKLDNLSFSYPTNKEIETKVHNNQWYEEYNTWMESRPENLNPTIEEPILEYNDKEKAQWYVNLWHRMNGESEEKDGLEETSDSKTYTQVTSKGTTSTTRNIYSTRNRWDILEDGLMNSQDWLKYALESGTVSLERVNFTEPTENGTGLKKATWTSIIYTNALDISEQTDETAIARAEAKYQQKTREIENKDKQFDSMLKLLDTEHNALQQEYETAKTVITKNMERTIKIYQA